MRVSTAIFLLATAVLAVPAPDLGARRNAVLARGTEGLQPSDFDQGNGFYMATFNETTSVMDVSFRPVAEMLDASLDISPFAKRSAFDLAKRDTTCSGLFSGDVPSLDWANVRLADNVNNQYFGYHQWGWVHNNGETSFLCSNDDGQYLLRQLIIDMQIVVSQRCSGSAGYGYDRRFQGGGAKDLTVGRTWRGDHFCDGKYHG